MATPHATVFPDWASRLIDELDAADRAANQLVNGLTAQQLNWQPTPAAWSIGQCLEHLCITNELLLSSISDSLAGETAGAVREIRPGWFGRWFIRSFIEPSPQTKKARAPGKIVPGSRVELTVLDRFLHSNQTARETIRLAANHNVNRIRYRNPFIPLIRFTAGTGLAIVTGHERRHLLQAERVRQYPGFPG